MILATLILMITVFLMLVIYEPYIDVFKVDGKYNIIVWYTNLDNERNYINILGG